MKEKTANLPSPQKNRDEYLDCCRALCFVLVVMHHSGFPYGKYILGFHMPCFFIISGMVLNTIKVSERDPIAFCIKRFKQLIIPYFVYEFLNLFISFFINLIRQHYFQIDIAAAIKSIITCINSEQYTGISMRLWFLPCMAIASSVFVLLLPKRKIAFPIHLTILALIAFFHYLLTAYLPVRLPFTLDISLFALLWVWMGYVLKDILYRVRKLGMMMKAFIFLSFLILFILSVYYNPQPLYMYDNTYGVYPLAFLSSFFGSFCFLFLIDIIPETCSQFISIYSFSFAPCREVYFLFFPSSVARSTRYWFSLQCIPFFF